MRVAQLGAPLSDVRSQFLTLWGLAAFYGCLAVMVRGQEAPADRLRFAIRKAPKLADERRRDGGFDWGVFEDFANESRFVETFMLDSWVEHLHQHERITHADRELQELVNRVQIEGAPKVT